MSKLEYQPPAAALAKWNPELRAAASDDDRTINIYDQIGLDPWTGAGMTAKIVSSVLRKAEGKEVVVNINSPGGDFFEGLAIHNMLAGYEGAVKVNVIGLAASAASVIAMAGDEVNVAESGFIMIHNAWTIAMGNKDDFDQYSDMLAKFDESMKGLYATRTGMDPKKIASMMDAETWLSGKEAVEMAFADAILPQKSVALEENGKSGKNAALRKLDLALARANMPRSKRRELLKEFTDTPGAVATVTPSADNAELVKSLKDLAETLKQRGGL